MLRLHDDVWAEFPAGEDVHLQAETSQSVTHIFLSYHEMFLLVDGWLSSLSPEQVLVVQDFVKKRTENPS